MRFGLASLALTVGLACPAAAQTFSAHLQPESSPITAAIRPDPVGALPTPEAEALARANAEHHARHAAFEARVSERGTRAIASVCSTCRIGLAPTYRDSRRLTRSVSSPTLADAESIYSVRRGFDPALALMD